MGTLKYEYIAIEGPPKAGKKDLSFALSTQSYGRILKDVEENPFLDKFYSNPNDLRIPLLTQLVFLMERGRTLISLRERKLFKEIIFTPFILQKDRIYANLFLREDEFIIYNKIYDLFKKNIRPPDFIIFLQLTTNELINRIRKYGSEKEKSVKTEYWKELNEAYNHFIFHYEDVPSLVVKADNLNFQKNDDAIKEIISEANSTKNEKKFFFIEEEE
jgi:deoxyadenosine/deoxycytidine kinase